VSSERFIDADPLIGKHVGEYCVERKLGEGGMSTVYAAIHPLIGKHAAIKVMSLALCTDAHAVLRFVQEARAVNQIGHPNIVEVFSFGRLPDGRSYFVMEWLKGETLFQRMLTRRLELEECFHVVDQIAVALEAAHRQGIIHRDIKPANIFLVPVPDGPDQVKLLDFGLAKLTSAESSPTRPNRLVGTPDYLSPEQALAETVDGAADVYGLGTVFFELVLERRPFEGDNPIDVVRKHVLEPPPAPSSLWPSIPGRLEALILSMLAKDPARRPTPAEVRAAIARLRHGSSPSVRNAPIPRPPRRDLGRVQRLVGVVVLAAGFGLLGAGTLRPKVPTVKAARFVSAPSRSSPSSLSSSPSPPSRPSPSLPSPAVRLAPPTGTSGPPVSAPDHQRKVRKRASHDLDYLLDPFSD